MYAMRLDASALRAGDRMPAVSFGPGALVESVSEGEAFGGNYLRVIFAEPVHSRYSPERMLLGMNFLPGDVVFVRRQCEAWLPSPVSGGMTDARCVEDASVESEGEWFCAGCAGELL